MAGPLLLHLALLIFFSFSSQAAQVSWSSPAAGTVFGPGDTLIASWTANSTTKASKNSTAAFRLCETDLQGSQNGTASCGESVAPLIQQSAGSYIASFALPNVTNEVGFYLEMDDASGRKSTSPNFSLAPAPGISNVTLVNNNTRAELPDINANHVPVPVAALAIPLSFVGLILFCCVFLCFHHHRKLKQERAHDAQRLALAREKLGYGPKQASPKPSAPRVIYLDSRPASPGQKRSFKEPVKRGYSYYQDVYTPVYYSRTRSSDSTPPDSPRYRYQQHPPHPASRSHSRREGDPRQYTREPFYMDMERTPMEPLERGPSQDYFQLPHGYQHTSRPRNVPAGLFRSVKSPVVQERRGENQARYQYRSAYPVPPGLESHRSCRSEPRSERGRRGEKPAIRVSRATTASTLPTRRHFALPTHPERPSSRPVSTHHYHSEPSTWERGREEEEDAYVNDGVITNYLAPSPNLNPSPSVAVPACLSPRVPTRPDRLHVRSEARSFDFEKPLPTAPSRGYGYVVNEDPVYRAVADALMRR